MNDPIKYKYAVPFTLWQLNCNVNRPANESWENVNSIVFHPAYLMNVVGRNLRTEDEIKAANVEMDKLRREIQGSNLFLWIFAIVCFVAFCVGIVTS